MESNFKFQTAMKLFVVHYYEFFDIAVNNWPLGSSRQC